MSAIIYCLRCMVGYDIPLNQVLQNVVTTVYGNANAVSLRYGGGGGGERKGGIGGGDDCMCPKLKL